MFKKKLLLTSSLIMSGLGASAVAVACDNTTGGGSGTKYNDSKEIIIAVDGAQENFYKKVVELYNKTDIAKKGYKIKTITKNVFDAVNTDVGITDESVPDIFYAPQDRVIDLAVKKAVVELKQFEPNILEEIGDVIGATDEEKADMVKFGSVVGKTGTGANTKLESRLFALRHNVEGIVLASTKTADEARKELNNQDTDSLEELVKAGKAIIRLQDFWYGNGILGGVFRKLQQQENLTEDLMSKILYPNNAKTVSGFQESADNKYKKEFRTALDVASRLYFPIYEAAYLKTPEQYQETVWAKKGITQEDLKAVLVSDMGQVQNKIFELMKQGKIDYAIIGTWDLQTSENTGGAKSFFNVINTTDDYEYRQASGAWSYLINNRNANASPDRKRALIEVIKIALQTEPNFEYFKADSKVQFTKAAQAKIKEKVLANSEATATKYQQFYKSLGYNSHEELLRGLASIVEVGNSANLTPFYQWEVKNNNTDEAIADANILKSESFSNNSTITGVPKISAESKADFVKTLKEETGLRNALAAMYGKTLSTFESPKKDSWWISTGILKDEALAKYKATLGGGEGLHLRKIEKTIFGADGDQNDDKKALVDSLVKALEANKLEEEYVKVENAALAFVKETASTPAADDVIKKAARLYLNNYVNQALWEMFIKAEITKIEKSELPEGVTVARIQTEVNNFLKTLSFDKLLEVLSSNRQISEGGLGVIKFQSNRIDNSNPILGANLWDNWNNQTFGNATFLDAIAKEAAANKDLMWFQSKIAEQLNQRYTQVTAGINQQTGASTIIDFDK